ncbi:metal-dependent hydrolase [Halegenticoccus tardaugens]|uniref:metal-dependent hydrolase n=1 Tax=Halegenticoccus tardaugens TaxID=2071624 RepID=UPI00100B6E92|nr:metal-dependent hydrolase [Halegenticoccus tardaugens]
MFAGHALLAFALVASVAARSGRSRERALALGAVAAAYAALPDVDMSYALVGVVGAAGGDALAIASSFWAAGNLVHRGITHSLVVAPFVALAAFLVVRGRRGGSTADRVAAAALVLSLIAIAAAASGPLGGAVMALFGVGAVVVAEVVARRTHVRPTAVAGAALFGLASHPFGDLLTGEPPAMLYPIDAALFVERVALASDPTVHLLGAFAVELATIWAAVVVYCRLADRPIRPAVNPRAALGLGYAASVLLIPTPTLDLSYPFVFSVLAVGAIGVVPRVRPFRGPTLEIPEAPSAALTGLAAVTLAGLAYAAAYLVA